MTKQMTYNPITRLGLVAIQRDDALDPELLAQPQLLGGVGRVALV